MQCTKCIRAGNTYTLIQFGVPVTSSVLRNIDDATRMYFGSRLDGGRLAALSSIHSPNSPLRVQCSQCGLLLAALSETGLSCDWFELGVGVEFFLKPNIAKLLF